MLSCPEMWSGFGLHAFSGTEPSMCLLGILGLNERFECIHLQTPPFPAIESPFDLFKVTRFAYRHCITWFLKYVFYGIVKSSWLAYALPQILLIQMSLGIRILLGLRMRREYLICPTILRIRRSHSPGPCKFRSLTPGTAWTWYCFWVGSLRAFQFP